MNTYVIAGGNSGIGLEAARQLLAAGHRLILLGRDPRKGEAALVSFGDGRERASFLGVDLATHEGVREAARAVEGLTDRIDGMLHSAAVFETRDVRTVDGIPLFPALSYFSRYHLTQLLLPKLLQAKQPRVVMFCVPMKTLPRVNPAVFPQFSGFNFRAAIPQVNGACYYYADHLTKQHPRVLAGCMFPGLVRTGLFRNAPWRIRASVALIGPLAATPVVRAAHGAVQALLHAAGSSAVTWNTPGNHQDGLSLHVDRLIQTALMDTSRDVTGA